MSNTHNESNVLSERLHNEEFRESVERYLSLPIGNLIMNLMEYARYGRNLGHFLTCIIENDLSGAIIYADEKSLKYIRDIISFMYDIMPSSSWGSRHYRKEWSSRSQDEREELTRRFSPWINT